MAEDKNIMSKNILIVSSDEEFSRDISRNLGGSDYRVIVATTQPEAISAMENNSISIALVDIKLARGHEIDLVSYIKTNWGSTEIIILASIDRLEDATTALRCGASFYLIKPVSFSDIKSAVDKAVTRVDQYREHMELQQRVLSELMAGSVHMQKILKLALKIAPTNSTVLISGESGTGKEFFARIIHRASQRYNANFVAINCGAIPDTLFESEFFGHKKGSFTGADRDKSGLVEEANMGTLFLDEIGELSASAQVKLLRFIQERTFRRIGEAGLRSVDVRIIAATNKNLAKLVQEGRFREDLFYRINVFNLYLPPLRERKETIPALVRLFVHKNNIILNKRIEKISKSAELALATYDYPGNIRELENIIEHAMVMAQGNEIREQDLPEFMHQKKLLLTPPQPQGQRDSETKILTLEEVEKDHIRKVLTMFNFNFSETAKKLGVSRSTLWRKIRQYKLGTENSIPNS